MTAIASLIPSGTDLVIALGMADHLIGVSHECDHPVAAGLPVLTRPGIPSAPQAAPGDVDAAVGAALAAGTSLYQAERELLHRLAPEVVVSQDVCDVCAVDGPTARASVPAGARLVMLTATSLVGLAADVRAVAAACGVQDAGEELVARVDARMDEVRAPVAGRPRPRVLALEWSDPPFLGGHWVPELVEIAGGEHVLSGPGEASRRATWDEIAAADPDVLVFMPCGYSLDEATRELGELLSGSASPVAGLRAVRDERVWATDATRLYSRCTPAAVMEGVRTLAGILHPGVAAAPDVRAARHVVP